jgi:NADPH2 dehydrogenase
VTDTVHAKGCRIFLQLNALGRAADKGFPKMGPSAIGLDQRESAIPIEDSGSPKAMTEHEIHECIQEFATAAENAIKAGFDGVEIHGGNGYLIDQFLQESCNQRSDRWGSSVVNRSRFGFQVTKAVVGAVGGGRVGFRISPWSTYMGIKPHQPKVQFLDLVSRLKNLDLAYLHIIESCVDNWYDVNRSESIEFLMEEWNNKTPVLVAGGYDGITAKEAVDRKYAAFDTVVAFGRSFLSTPDLVNRIKLGNSPNPYDSRTFYTPELLEGYIDYPTAD